MDLELSVADRTVTGKATKRLRRDGIVPGVVFGKGSDSVPVQLDAKELETLYRSAGKTSIVRLRMPGGGRPKSVLIRDLQRHPLTGRALHVDLFLVDLTHEMQADIPIVFIGEAPVVDRGEGTLLANLDHLKVRALPADLPHQIEVDVSTLVDLEASVHVRDVPIPGDGKVTVLNDPDELVAKATPLRAEEEVEAAAAEAVEGEEGAAPAEGAEADATAPAAGAEETES
ncbi:MAG: 50S ribosomal protein L25 [Chloroflexota bacterium]|nr:50S ribosomal protein L25 [Chloroflexota bacterium]